MSASSHRKSSRSNSPSGNLDNHGYTRCRLLKRRPNIIGWPLRTLASLTALHNRVSRKVTTAECVFSRIDRSWRSHSHMSAVAAASVWSLQFAARNQAPKGERRCSVRGRFHTTRPLGTDFESLGCAVTNGLRPMPVSDEW